MTINHSTALAAVLALAGAPALAEPLDNLERERAHFVAMLVDPAIGADARAQRVGAAIYRLRDLERIVMSDDALLGDDRPDVRRAFLRYELTFLVHAAAEAERAPVEQWFDAVGLSSAAIRNAKDGPR